MATIYLARARQGATATSPLVTSTITDAMGATDSLTATINAVRIFISTAQVNAEAISGSPGDPPALIFLAQASVAADPADAVPSPTLFVTITDAVGVGDTGNPQRMDWGYNLVDQVGVTDTLVLITTPPPVTVRRIWFGGVWVTPVRQVWTGGNWHNSVGT